MSFVLQEIILVIAKSGMMLRIEACMIRTSLGISFEGIALCLKRLELTQ
jgi:hypothetical protein